MANIAASRMHPFHPKQLSDIEMQVVTCDLLIIGGGNTSAGVQQKGMDVNKRK